MNYIKFLIMLVMTFLTWLTSALTGDDNVSPEEWTNSGIVLAAAIGVWYFSNDTAAKFAKAVAAGLGAAAALLNTALADGVTNSEWIQVGLAGAGAVLVLASPGPQWVVTRLLKGGSPPPATDQSAA